MTFTQKLTFAHNFGQIALKDKLFKIDILKKQKLHYNWQLATSNKIRLGKFKGISNISL